MRNVVIGAGWLWGLFALPRVTNAGMDFGDPFLLLLSGGVIGLAWAVYSATVPAVFRTPVRWLWLSVPVIGLGSLLLSFTHRDLALRVWLCDSELREYAEAVHQNPESAPRVPQHVGLFRVRETVADEKQVMLHTASGFMDSSGVVYRPDGTPPESGSGFRRLYGYQHLYGPWWWFYEVAD